MCICTCSVVKRVFQNIVKDFEISAKFFVFFYIPYLHCLFGHKDIGTTPFLSIQKNKAENNLQEKSTYKFFCDLLGKE
jgi:hypothetical protein